MVSHFPVHASFFREFVPEGVPKSGERCERMSFLQKVVGFRPRPRPGSGGTHQLARSPIRTAVERIWHVPHGGVRHFHQKSTCLMQLT